MKKLVAILLMAGMLAPFAASPARADGFSFSYHEGRGHNNGGWNRHHDDDDRRRHWSRDWDDHRGSWVQYGGAWRFQPYYPAPVYVAPRVVIVPAPQPVPQYWYYDPRY